MPETETIYVRPTSGTGKCSECGQDVPPQWEVSGSRTGKATAGPFATRGEAKQSALDNRTQEAVVLLRADGSEYGELAPAVRGGEPAQVVDAGIASDGDE
jgi:hypothetical protein